MGRRKPFGDPRIAPHVCVLFAALTLPVLAACPPSSDCEVLLTCGPAEQGQGAASTSSNGGSGTKSEGERCTAATECASGFCTDDVCCATACDATCEACSTDGTCVAHPPGADPEDECGAGSCAEAGVCAQGAHVWSLGFQGDNATAANLAVDQMGNVAFGGHLGTPGSITIDSNVHAATAGPKIYVAKFSSTGTHLWNRAFAGASGGAITLSDVAVDSLGNVIVFGWYEQPTLNLGGTTFTNQSGFDLFVAKYSGTSGAHLWSKTFGVSSLLFGWSMAVDQNDNIVVVGDSMGGSIDFGGGPIGGGNTWSFFAAKLTKDGAHLWSKGWGSLDAERITDATVDDAGNVILVGAFDGTLNVGSGVVLTSQGTGSFFVLKVTANAGNHIWSAAYGVDVLEPFFFETMSVAADGEGNVLWGGRYRGSIDFGGRLFAADGDDHFLVKLGSAGNHVWSKRFSNASQHPLYAVGTDPKDDVVIAGAFSGTLDLGGEPLAPAGAKDVYVAKFNGEGIHLWSRAFGDRQDQHVIKTATDADGNVYLFGHQAGEIAFGGDPISGVLFLAKLGP